MPSFAVMGRLLMNFTATSPGDTGADAPWQVSPQNSQIVFRLCYPKFAQAFFKMVPSRQNEPEQSSSSFDSQAT
jgi:hypothetical protein